MTLNSEVQPKPTPAVEHGAFFLGVRARNPNLSTVLFIQCTGNVLQQSPAMVIHVQDTDFCSSFLLNV